MVNGMFKEISEEEKMSVNGGKITSKQVANAAVKVATTTMNAASKVYNSAPVQKVVNSSAYQKAEAKVVTVAVKAANTVVNWYRNKK